MSELEPMRIVHLIDDKTNEEIEMEVYVEIDVEGRTYALLTPHEAVVSVLKVTPGETEDEETLEELEPSEYPAIKSQVEEALREWSCSLEVRADEFVLVGEPPAEFYEESESMEVDTDEGPSEYLILAEVDTGDANYIIATPADPQLFPVELLADNKARSLSDEELADMEETFRAAIQDEDEEE